MVSHANIHKKLTRRGRKAAKKDAETTEAVPNDEATAPMDEPSPDNNLETNIETNAEDDVGQTEMET